MRNSASDSAQKPPPGTAEQQQPSSHTGGTGSQSLGANGSLQDVSLSGGHHQYQQQLQQHDGTTTHAVNSFSGVKQEDDGSWRSILNIDLGTFTSKEEAARAFDKAALFTLGFAGCSYAPLPEIIARAAQCHQQIPQLLPAGVPLMSTLRGVALRGGSYIAQLDIGGRPYELGPFATELDAAKAFDKYSLLLHGVNANTNLPSWEHLATKQEVASLADAVQIVANQAAVGIVDAATAGQAQHQTCVVCN